MYNKNCGRKKFAVSLNAYINNFLNDIKFFFLTCKLTLINIFRHDRQEEVERELLSTHNKALIAFFYVAINFLNHIHVSIFDSFFKWEITKRGGGTSNDDGYINSSILYQLANSRNSISIARGRRRLILCEDRGEPMLECNL